MARSPSTFSVRRQHSSVPRAPVPPAVLAVLTDAVATPLHGLKRVAKLQPGETLVVLGVGGLGSNAVQIGQGDGGPSHRRDTVGGEAAAGPRARRRRDRGRRRWRSGRRREGPDRRPRTGRRHPVRRLGSRRRAGHRHGRSRRPGRADRCESSIPSGHERWTSSGGSSPSSGRAGSCRTTSATPSTSILMGRSTVDHLVQAVRPLEAANEALDDLRAGRVLRSVLLP